MKTVKEAGGGSEARRSSRAGEEARGGSEVRGSSGALARREGYGRPREKGEHTRRFYGSTGEGNRPYTSHPTTADMNQRRPGSG